MTDRRKPRHRSDYSREETDQVEAALLTVAVTLGALMDRICIVGGLVPSLLVDREIGPDPETDAGHPGTNDLDVGLAIALLDDRLALDFDSPESHGPLRASEFDGQPGGDLDAGAADAHGYVDDLLRQCRRRGYLGDPR